jgi:translocation and assembly module TamA
VSKINPISLLAIALSLQGCNLAYAQEPIAVKKTTKETTLKRNQEVVTRIELVGVKGVLQKNIEARLPAFKPECNADLEKLGRYEQTIIKKLDKATRALGYYHSKASFSVQKVNNCWQVTVNVSPGPPVKVIRQDIKIIGKGMTDRKTSQLFNELPLPYKPQGSTLNHLIYSDYKSQLVELAQENGYLGAKFTKKEILVDLKKNTAVITLHFDTGIRYRYGNVQVEQQVLDGKYLQRYIRLKKNQHYSSSALIEQQQLLQNSGYYSSISVHADYEHAKNGVIPISIKLTKKKRDHYRLNLGYGTDTGYRVKASMNRRWTGSAGKKLNIAIGLSQRINEISSQLVVPKDNPEKNNLFYNLGIKHEVNEDVRSESVRFGVISTSLVEHDWKRNLSLSYLSDRTQVENQKANRSNLTLLGVQFAKVRADNRISPKKGWRVRFQAEGAIDKVLSDASVLQLQAHGKYINKLGDGRILVRANFGTTFGDRLNNLPKDLRFFSGGINSLRGYGYETLGEVNSDGKVIGGKQLLELSLEYEHPIKDKWSVAGFIDAGNAFDEFQLNEIKVGVGLGVRWNSPIGPVRFDLGVPSENLSDVHLHLSIGPDL